MPLKAITGAQPHGVNALQLLVDGPDGQAGGSQGRLQLNPAVFTQRGSCGIGAGWWETPRFKRSRVAPVPTVNFQNVGLQGKPL